MPRGRNPEEPTAEQILQQMTPGEPYRASDIAHHYDEVSRATIYNRLEAMHEQGLVERKRHRKGQLTWWVPE